MSASEEGITPEVTIVTSMGSFTVEMYYKHSQRTCRNFIELSRRGYYNNVKFHRIIKDFIVQGGDPTGTGRGGESIYGAKFEDEIKLELKHTGVGILSMANVDPNTNGSQFFITLAPTQSLDGKHTILGEFAKEWKSSKDLAVSKLIILTDAGFYASTFSGGPNMTRPHYTNKDYNSEERYSAVGELLNDMLAATDMDMP